eukprot:1699608-Rhodomonas_salina.6
MDGLASYLGATPLSLYKNGEYRAQLPQDYFKKIDSVDFAINQDDSRNPRNYCKADVVLVAVKGVARSSSFHIAPLQSGLLRCCVGLPCETRDKTDTGTGHSGWLTDRQAGHTYIRHMDTHAGVWSMGSRALVQPDACVVCVRHAETAGGNLHGADLRPQGVAPIQNSLFCLGSPFWISTAHPMSRSQTS